MEEMESDLVMIRRMARGDRAALEELYDRHAKKVYGLALRLTGSRETAGRMTVDVFRSAWEHAWIYRQESHQVRTWLLKMCRVLADQNNEGDPERPPEAVRLTLPVSGERVREAVDRLPKKQREILDLLYFRKMTRKQAAGELDEPIPTVTLRTHSAFLKLRRNFGRRGQVGEAERG
ncbi:RNA polymerase sigma-70 factor (ECF subfamily) [Melghirimyces profundicolus]|uniref:RNA polymerase sigma-70 factor (ECF subfamily) n=1 Tax=Melghirimyces profundicolus TaxID=1242148 RepID=A0A2T6C4S5_9BACL|nr:sigma factor-like helix-turn-helix DNA-binding protein [Melghirimyces profundicolus]PTX63320.1 RNA polymerase sigma-70 factor (ECF subfamily) [Melghirimyces profundicolus]